MLPILIGEATRFAELGLNAEKLYRLTLDLSYQTETLDCEGEIQERFNGSISEKQFQQVLVGFAGEQLQVPPAYSAIRLEGKRAYILARKGEEVEIPPRTVTVFNMKLLDFSFPAVTLEVRCSKGTYIRSLARDIGEKLGMGGCVTALRRLSTGGWPQSMMVSFESLVENKQQCILPLAQWLRDFSRQELSSDEAKRFVQGQRIQLGGQNLRTDENCKRVAVFANRNLLGTGDLKPGMRRIVLHPVRIIPSAQEMFS
jgi:tRNA pseudouridine55 synthase